MPPKGKIVQWGLVLLLVAGWVILRAVRPAWAEVLFSPGARLGKDYGWWVPAVGGGLMALAMAGVCWPLVFKKWRRGDDAMGLGCLMMFAWGLGAVMVGFAVCVVLRVHVVVNAVSFGAMALGVFILPQLGWALWKDRRRGRGR